MKGVILAGGLGTRLSPLTRITNKHLLPVYNKPMIYYPIETLVGAGLKDILVVTGGNSAGDFLRLLGNGRHFGLSRLNYAYQEGEGGIADALKCAEAFAEGQPIVVILGDNLLGAPGLKGTVEAFRKQKRGARVLLKEVPNPRHYGVAAFQKGRIVKIVEKPKDPPSPYAVIGVYCYDAAVFKIVETLKPSKRGELEITDLNNAYIQRRQLAHDIFPGWWQDAGESIDALFEANRRVAEAVKVKG